MISIAEKAPLRLGLLNPLNALRSRLEEKGEWRQARYDVMNWYREKGFFEVMGEVKERLLREGSEAELYWSLIFYYGSKIYSEEPHFVKARSGELVPDKVPNDKLGSSLVLNLSSWGTCSSVFVSRAYREATLIVNKWQRGYQWLKLETPYEPNNQNWRDLIKEAVTSGIYEQQFPDPGEHGFARRPEPPERFHLPLDVQFPDS